MEMMYRIALFVVIMGAGAAAEGVIIHLVYKLGRADGWDAARSLYRNWRRGDMRTALNGEADAA